MKKILIWALVLIGIMMGSCTSSDDASDVQSQMGSIYGIVTELGTSEPMKAIGVELYKGKYKKDYYNNVDNELLLKTVTFDDGHFEFKDLEAGSYTVRVVADGYEQTEGGYVTVEAGRQARVDLQVKKIDTKVVVSTQEATVNCNEVLFTAEFTYNSGYYPSEVGFVYSPQNNPSNDGTIVKCKKEEIEETSSTYTKTFSTKVSGLGKGTYYFQAYAINSIGKTYSEVRSFSMSGNPGVSTLAVTNVTKTTATLNGRIDYEGDPAYTERGFVYSKSFPRPTVEDPSNATTKISVSGRSEDFSANVSSLTENAQYYVRAYATNVGGTVYGEVKTFKPGQQDYVIIDNLMVQTKDLGSSSWSAAQQMCTNSRIGGYSDWRLPTIGELAMIYTHKDEIGGFKNEGYWSSSGTTNDHYYYNFSSGLQKQDYYDSKQFYIRAVRTVK